MSYLACEETVTLLRYTGSGYDSCTLEKASWYDKTIAVKDDRGLTFQNALQVRIPPQSFPDDWEPQIGDFLVRGTVSDEITIQSDLAAYRPRKVLTVGDNRRGSLPHWKLVCQ